MSSPSLRNKYLVLLLCLFTWPILAQPSKPASAREALLAVLQEQASQPNPCAIGLAGIFGLPNVASRLAYSAVQKSTAESIQLFLQQEHPMVEMSLPLRMQLAELLLDNVLISSESEVLLDIFLLYLIQETGVELFRSGTKYILDTPSGGSLEIRSRGQNAVRFKFQPWLRNEAQSLAEDKKVSERIAALIAAPHNSAIPGLALLNDVKGFPLADVDPELLEDFYRYPKAVPVGLPNQVEWILKNQSERLGLRLAFDTSVAPYLARLSEDDKPMHHLALGGQFVHWVHEMMPTLSLRATDAIDISLKDGEWQFTVFALSRTFRRPQSAFNRGSCPPRQ